MTISKRLSGIICLSLLLGLSINTSVFAEETTNDNDETMSTLLETKEYGMPYEFDTMKTSPGSIFG